MKVSCRLVVRCNGPDLARRLADVLAPDNVGVPKRQTFTVKPVSESLVFSLEGESVASMSVTLVSLLKDIQVFQEVWLLSRGEKAAVQRSA